MSIYESNISGVKANDIVRALRHVASHKLAPVASFHFFFKTPSLLITNSIFLASSGTASANSTFCLFAAPFSFIINI